MVIILIATATVLYTLFEIFASRAAGKIDANLSSIILNGVGAIIPLLIYVALRLSQGAKIIATTASGMVYSLLGGIAIAAFSVILIKIFEKEPNLGYVIPLIYGGSILLASLAGWFIFKEPAPTMQIVGVVAVTVGLGLIVFSKYNLS